MIDSLNIIKEFRRRFRAANRGIFMVTDPAYGSIWKITVYPSATISCEIPHWTFEWNPFAHEPDKLPLLTVTSPTGIKTVIQHNSGKPYDVRQFADYVENIIKTGVAEKVGE